MTGEIDRTTEFERGLAVQQAFRDGEWQPDPFIHDDQALVADVRGKGLVVITGCCHAGLINTVRHARKLTGVDRVFAVVGGFHLGTPVFEPVIPPTVEALAEFDPRVVAPTHCTGWRAIHALAAAFPTPSSRAAWAPGTSSRAEAEGGWVRTSRAASERVLAAGRLDLIPCRHGRCRDEPGRGSATNAESRSLLPGESHSPDGG